MRCVVCAIELGDGVEFANAWERSLGLRACCGAECAARFDPDRNWMPSAPPASAGDAESGRLIAAANDRVGSGEAAPLVAKDLLLAGVDPATVRRTLAGAMAAAESRAAATRRREGALLLALGGLVGALVAVFGARRGRAGASPAGVEHVIAAWEERFGSTVGISG